MLHKMSELRGWSHQEMMDMPKHIFFRYYGYYYQDQLRQEEEYKKQEDKQKKENAKKQPRNWKSLKGR